MWFSEHTMASRCPSTCNSIGLILPNKLVVEETNLPASVFSQVGVSQHWHHHIPHSPDAADQAAALNLSVVTSPANLQAKHHRLILSSLPHSLMVVLGE